MPPKKIKVESKPILFHGNFTKTSRRMTYKVGVNWITTNNPISIGDTLYYDEEKELYRKNP